MIRFLCGCSSKITPPIGDPRLLRTFDAVTFDEEGFIICAIHRHRRLGWRSVPYTATQRPAGLPADMTEHEWEQWILFRTEPKRGKVEISFEDGDRGIRDIRDNRPATGVGDATIAGLENQSFHDYEIAERTEEIHDF